MTPPHTPGHDPVPPHQAVDSGPQTPPPRFPLRSQNASLSRRREAALLSSHKKQDMTRDYWTTASQPPYMLDSISSWDGVGGGFRQEGYEGGGLYSQDELPAGGRGEAGLLSGRDRYLYGVSRSSPDEALREVAGIKRQWRSRACCASVQQRRWEDAAGSRAAPAPVP